MENGISQRGHVDDGEKIGKAAIREVFEETGCEVKLKGVLPIVSINLPSGETHVLIRFVAEILQENIVFDKNEILDVKWIEVEKIKNMAKEEIRGYETTQKFLKDLESKNIYPLAMICDDEFEN